MNIDWLSAKTHILTNPRMLPNEQRGIHEQLKQFSHLQGHVWVASSGSTAVSSDGIKWVALSKAAILSSARSVNAHLQCQPEDLWITALPNFHVGGLGIWARSFLAQVSVIDCLSIQDKWNPALFCEMAHLHGCTLSALVPAQVYDLVVQKHPAPDSLRAVVVGGGKLAKSLYQKALKLGWKLLPSYGLTECSSQVATAELIDTSSDYEPHANLKILPHVQVNIDAHGYICLKGDSLLSGYVIKEGRDLSFIDPKKNGWLTTEDKGQVEGEGHFLHIMGRQSNFVKIGGESSDLSRLDSILEELKFKKSISIDMALVALPEERLGQVIHLAVVEQASCIQMLIADFNCCVLPFERIRAVHVVEEIPRTALKKLQRESLLKQILNFKASTY